MKYQTQVNFEGSYIKQLLRVRPLTGELISFVPDPQNNDFDYDATYLINQIKTNVDPEFVDLELFVSKIER